MTEECGVQWGNTRCEHPPLGTGETYHSVPVLPCLAQMPSSFSDPALPRLPQRLIGTVFGGSGACRVLPSLTHNGSNLEGGQPPVQADSTRRQWLDSEPQGNNPYFVEPRCLGDGYCTRLGRLTRQLLQLSSIPTGHRHCPLQDGPRQSHSAGSGSMQARCLWGRQPPESCPGEAPPVRLPHHSNGANPNSSGKLSKRPLLA
jgi:hypothetical protein